MMREKLQQIAGLRRTFTATFKRYGQKTAYKGPPTRTLLFIDVRTTPTDQPVCDHLWFTTGKGFEAIPLEPGDRVSFRATSRPYLKGYRGRREDDDLPPLTTDFRLSHPRDLRLLRPPSEEQPASKTADAKRGTCTAFSPPTPHEDGAQLSLF